MPGVRELEIQLDSLRSSSETIVTNLTKAGTTCDSLGVGLHAAIVLKEHQKFEEAGRVFAHLESRWARDERFAYEHVQFLRRVGREDEADAVLVKALDGSVGGELLRECVVRGLIERPGTEIRMAILEKLVWTASHGVSAYHRGLINFLSSREIQAAFCAEEPPKRKLADYFNLCLEAIKSGRPFCLLRLGDGEGAFLNSLSSPPSQEAMFLNHREHFTARWYDDRALAADPAFLKVAAEIEAGLPLADIVGVPQPSWIKHEVRLRNLRSIVNCIQLARLRGLPAFSGKTVFATTTIAVDLEYSGLLVKLLKESGAVTLITSHAELGAKLEAAGRATVRRVIPIPPAHSDRVHTGYAPAASHFREAFAGVNAAIDTIAPGEVVLVAAGFLGKYYCLHIKRQGGIALDLGSLVDLWMGYATRPAFTGLSHLTLNDQAVS